VLGAAFSSGCTEAPQQDPDAVLVDWKSEHAMKANTVERRHQEIEVGSDPSVPVRIDWTAAVESEGDCHRIQDVKLTRGGGPPDFVIYNAEVKRLEPSCVKDPSFGEPVERFLVELCYRWKGASNEDDCAYQRSFLLDGDSKAIKQPPP
jgi:hypothetical protein